MMSVTSAFCFECIYSLFFLRLFFSCTGLGSLSKNGVLDLERAVIAAVALYACRKLWFFSFLWAGVVVLE
jgi:hypothetical protein